MTPSRHATATSGLAAAVALTFTALVPANAGSEISQSTTAATGGGRVYTMGYDASGTLGNGAPLQTMGNPQRLSYLTAHSKDVSLSRTLGAAVRTDGTLLTWGSNAYREVGSSTPTIALKPTVVPTPVPFVDVEAPGSALMGIDNEGGLWVRGGNGSGELLTGDTQPRAEFTKVTTPAPVAKVVFAQYAALIRTTDGRVFGAGSGQDVLALTSGSSSTQLVQIPLPGKAIALSAEGHSTVGVALAALEDGTVWAWGNNYNGQMGPDVTGQYTRTPVQIPLPGPAHKVAASLWGGAAVLDDGSVYTWGTNAQGQLGRGPLPTGPLEVPGRVPGLPPVKQISRNLSSTLVRTSDGRAFGWGENDYAHLGGPLPYRVYEPAQIPLPGTVLTLSNEVTSGFVVKESLTTSP